MVKSRIRVRRRAAQICSVVSMFSWLSLGISGPLSPVLTRSLIKAEKCKNGPAGSPPLPCIAACTSVGAPSYHPTHRLGWDGRVPTTSVKVSGGLRRDMAELKAVAIRTPQKGSHARHVTTSAL